VQDVLITVVGGLKGFLQAITKCSGNDGRDLHRASDPELAGFASLEDRESGAAALKEVYRAATDEEAALKPIWLALRNIANDFQ